MVAVPDLIVSEIAFAPAQTINDTPDQGVLSVHIGNRGSAASDTAWLAVEGIPAAVGRPAETLFRGLVEPIPVNGTATVTFPWMASMPGRYTIRATADPDSLVLELREDNNTAETAYVTVPKGILMAPDSVQVMATGYSRLEVPLVPEMYFDPNSEDIGESYTANTGVFPALLPTLSARLQENPDIVLRVMGAIDALSGETDTGLADRRAERVKEKLVELGAPAAQINVVGDHPSKVLGRRPMPKNPQDAEWVMEQNRVVTFATETQSEEVMFQPYEFAVDTTLRDSVQFVSKIVCPAGLKVWEIEGQTGILELDSRRAADGDSLWGVLIWRGTDQSKVVVPRNRWYHFALTVTDSLDRTFRTAIDSIYLEEKRTVERQELFGAAKFAKVEPVYAFYWDRVMSVASEMIGNPGMRLRFEGHACAIGPDKVNERLSTRRAADFTQKFLERVKAKYPQNYENIRRRIAEPMGAGEREPLILKLKGIGEVLMGDNRTPTGRYLNRRIAVLLYREN
jgi:outer membrane protein OmpA-like peptidoglycan-associated protein